VKHYGNASCKCRVALILLLVAAQGLAAITKPCLSNRHSCSRENGYPCNVDVRKVQNNYVSARNAWKLQGYRNVKNTKAYIETTRNKGKNKVHCCKGTVNRLFTTTSVASCPRCMRQNKLLMSSCKSDSSQ